MKLLYIKHGIKKLRESVVSEETDAIYLSTNELKKIYELDLSGFLASAGCLIKCYSNYKWNISVKSYNQNHPASLISGMKYYALR